jgi:hypothetical protein
MVFMAEPQALLMVTAPADVGMPALRDAMRAAGFKAKWFNPIEAVAEKRQAMAEMEQKQAEIEAMGAAGEASTQAAQGAAAMDALEQEQQ